MKTTMNSECLGNQNNKYTTQLMMQKKYLVNYYLIIIKCAKATIELNDLQEKTK